MVSVPRSDRPCCAIQPGIRGTESQKSRGGSVCRRLGPAGQGLHPLGRASVEDLLDFLGEPGAEGQRNWNRAAALGRTVHGAEGTSERGFIAAPPLDERWRRPLRSRTRAHRWHRGIRIAGNDHPSARHDVGADGAIDRLASEESGSRLAGAGVLLGRSPSPWPGAPPPEQETSSFDQGTTDTGDRTAVSFEAVTPSSANAVAGVVHGRNQRVDCSLRPSARLGGVLGDADQRIGVAGRDRAESACDTRLRAVACQPGSLVGLR